MFDSSGNDNASNMDGLVFDTGFTADYHLAVRRGNDAGNEKFDIDFADLERRRQAVISMFSVGSPVRPIRVLV